MLMDGSAVFDEYTGRTKPRLELLQRWRDLVVLTLEPRYRWAGREAAPERHGIVLLPVTRAGITVLSDMIPDLLPA
jgi:hypothetical protein